ncbi:MAG: tRNA preQ1(34) S-adenosylmethionine ribosyltransferase-isomerase QueA [Betaproteobacteria bacterium]|nr:MAG: tRNA preQ1(34) S-adenosylmethionine ribosyltransferase-isomerase QueA [Betaproteobacteria bacterium]
MARRAVCAPRALLIIRRAVRLDDFDFFLPPELIAQQPAAERSASRLLCLDGRNGRIADRFFRDFASLVEAGDVVILNDTRVIKARLTGAKSTGGRVEVLIERILDASTALAQLRASKAPREGSRLRLIGGATARVLGREGEFYRLAFEGISDLFGYLDRHGAVPLPPYIDHEATENDASRYQTIYARNPGAVAAPTAGLHFDEATLEALRRRGAVIGYVTLHVGAGTFQPVRVDDVREHRMHREWFDVPEQTVAAVRLARSRGARVLAVGTTTLRALEAAAAAGELRAGYGETNLFILPGFRFRVVDRLLTNFHLPRSTLLMLVSAFGGMEHIRQAYAHAVRQRYRFFSYGDAMLIERAAQPQ